MSGRVRGVLAIEAVLLSLIFLALWSVRGLSPEYYTAGFHPQFGQVIEPNQYPHLADALIHGSVSLNLPVSDALAALDDPYDFMSRYEIGTELGQDIFWDHAFYQGSYFSYFGVVPAVLLFAPFQLVTGTYLSTSIAVAILGVLAICSGMFLVASVIGCYFSQTAGVGSALLCGAMFFGGSNIMYLGMVPTTYSVPILSSMVFTFAGIGLWMRAASILGHAGQHSGELTSREVSPAEIMLGGGLSLHSA